MQRSRPPPCAFSLLAYRLPIPFQRSPHWFPRWGRRFHDYFLGLLLEQPGRQRSQLFGAAAKHPPLKLVFAFDFDVRHNYSQHLFMDINSRYPIEHSSSWPGAESVLRLPYTGSRAIAAPPGKDNDAPLFAKSRTLLIRHLHGLNFSTVASTSPLRAVAILPLNDFHEVSRARSKARSQSNG